MTAPVLEAPPGAPPLTAPRSVSILRRYRSSFVAVVFGLGVGSLILLWAGANPINLTPGKSATDLAKGLSNIYDTITAPNLGLGPKTVELVVDDKTGERMNALDYIRAGREMLKHRHWPPPPSHRCASSGSH